MSIKPPALLLGLYSKDGSQESKDPSLPTLVLPYLTKVLLSLQHHHYYLPLGGPKRSVSGTGLSPEAHPLLL